MDTEEAVGVMNKPPKDVFTFMNLNFDLPISYYQAFGDFQWPSEEQKGLLKGFMESKWSAIKRRKVQYKVAFDHLKQVFNVILMGTNCPLSKCCKMTVCFQFDRGIGGGKVLCMETLCGFNPLDQFFMGPELLDQLFQDRDHDDGNSDGVYSHQP